VPDTSILSSDALTRSVLRILARFARLLLRHGLALPAFVELAKRAYLEAAMNDMALPGRKATISRAAVLTGLTRKEVQRLQSEPAPPAPELMSTHNRAARVLAGWVRDPHFHATPGTPATLPFDAGETSFAALVRQYGGDVPPRAVLDELMRVGAVERDAQGRLRALARAYIPRTSAAGKLDILGADVSYLIGTIDHNLEHGEVEPRFQRKVTYDNVPAEAVEEFRAMAAREGQALLERLGDWLAQHDRDVNPAVRGSGRMRVGVGVFAFEEDIGAPPREAPR
jgi:hypothetical protein